MIACLTRHSIHLAFRLPLIFGDCFRILHGIIVFIHEFLFIETTRGNGGFPGDELMTMISSVAAHATGAFEPAHGRAGEILGVAARLFAEQGYAGTRMTDVATGIGVTKPIIYRFYRSKQDLFEAVVEAALLARIDQAIKALDAIPVASAAALARFPHVAREVAGDAALTMPWVVALGESNKIPELGKNLLTRFGQPFIDALAALFDRTRAAGALRDGPTSADLAWLLLAPAVQLVICNGFGAMVNDPQRAVDHLQAHLDGFCRAWLK
jgi:AcrR family transcriptional regulator